MPATGRLLTVEACAAALFLCVAGVLLRLAPVGQLRPGVTALLVVMYAVFSRTIRLPLGAGSFVPSYLVLMPMLVLLPPATVPLLAALGALGGAIVQCAFGRVRPSKTLTAIADCWYAIGPALVLTLAGQRVGHLPPAVAVIGAVAAGFMIDLIASTLREWLTETVSPSLQVRVVMVVWAIDAGIVPLGMLLAYAAREDALELLLLVPLALVLMVVNHDRRLRIARSRYRLRAAIHRERLQGAAARVSAAVASRLDVGALGRVVLEAAMEIVSADSGYAVLGGDLQRVVLDGPKAAELRAELDAAGGAAWAGSQPCHLESGGRFALGLPLSALGRSDGVVAVARASGPFSDAERSALQSFAERVASTTADAPTYEELRVMSFTDPLTGVGNRRKLTADLNERRSASAPEQPLALALFDLDGFKGYNDRFGHSAGDALLTKLATRLAMAVSGQGAAYRLGGDEFCVLVAARTPTQLGAASKALSDKSTPFPITASFGSVLIPREATTLEQALSLADKRMYQHKRERASSAPRRNLFRVAT